MRCIKFVCPCPQRRRPFGGEFPKMGVPQRHVCRRKALDVPAMKLKDSSTAIEELLGGERWTRFTFLALAVHLRP